MGAGQVTLRFSRWEISIPVQGKGPALVGAVVLAPPTVRPLEFARQPVRIGREAPSRLPTSFAVRPLSLSRCSRVDACFLDPVSASRLPSRASRGGSCELCSGSKRGEKEGHACFFCGCLVGSLDMVCHASDPHGPRPGEWLHTQRGFFFMPTFSPVHHRRATEQLFREDRTPPTFHEQGAPSHEERF
jgi:hypothetical protein